MGIAQVFEKGPAPDRLPNPFPPGPPDGAPREEGIPVLPELAGLLPDGLRRGEAVRVDCAGGEPDYLCLALLAGALAGGLWCAAVGVPGLGIAALAGLVGSAGAGAAALDRLLLVPEPGERWAQVLTVLADGVDLLLARPPVRPGAQVASRIDARLRQRRTAGDGPGTGPGAGSGIQSGSTAHRAGLVVLGPWSSARLVLRTTETIWVGLHRSDRAAGAWSSAAPADPEHRDAYAGVGHLSGGRATVVAEGRATAGRPRTARLWLPGPDGAARALLDPVRKPGAAAGTSPGGAVVDISAELRERSRGSVAA
jgi:hypothetical protein